ncbi:MAG: hypothetical protein PW734_00020 [Verrucomicrobium sp.]|nr:hypothetical protein [Verrucomicrobium sp.]
MRQRIAIDMDEVVADALSRHISLYNAEFKTAFNPADLKGRDLHEAVPQAHAKRTSQFPHEEGFFDDLTVFPHCQEVIRELQEKYEIFFASAAMEFRHSLVPKHQWLHEHFPFVPWTHHVFCGDKSIINADYLIDDRVKNFTGFRGEGILFTAPHNEGITGYRRANDWLEVRQLFLG